MKFLLPNFINKEVIVQVEGMAVDYNFIKTMGITVIQGRDFSEEYGSDLTQSAILTKQLLNSWKYRIRLESKLEIIHNWSC